MAEKLIIFLIIFSNNASYKLLSEITQYLLVTICHGSRHEPEYNVLNGVVIEEGYVRVTMRV